MEVSDKLGKAPDRPHLALMSGRGTFIAIPPGATIAEIIDPADAQKITPLILISVSHNKWVFRCRCNPQCRVVYTHRIVGEGSHTGAPPLPVKKGRRR